FLCVCACCLFFFFFQAEDGIRDRNVTGVQTCALPILVHMTTVHHPYDPRIYHKQCKSLENAGFDVTLIARRDPKGNDDDKTINHILLKTYKSRLKRMIFG